MVAVHRIKNTSSRDLTVSSPWIRFDWSRGLIDCSHFGERVGFGCRSTEVRSTKCRGINSTFLYFFSMSIRAEYMVVLRCVSTNSQVPGPGQNPSGGSPTQPDFLLSSYIVSSHSRLTNRGRLNFFFVDGMGNFVTL